MMTLQQPAAARRRATVVPPWWPDDDTLGWWPFGASNSLNDQTTPANNWTAANGAEINDGGGTEVRSVQFVAASSQSLGQANIATSGDASAMIWIKFATVADAWLFQMRGTSSVTWGWQIVRLAAGGGVVTYLRTTDGTQIGPALIQASPSAGVWYCYGISIDNTAKTLTPYLAGVAGTPVSFAGKTAQYTGVMRIGSSGMSGSYFNGRANEALYVNRAVSAADHLAFYNGTKAYYGIA
jgi:hypothetical protein